MRIIATSDSHRRASILCDIVERHRDNADLFVHCGDSEGDLRQVKILFPDVKLKCVRGNCDFDSDLPYSEVFPFAGKTVMICHGHKFFVKHGYAMLHVAAKQQDADICIFGHTHTPMIEKLGNIYLINPGAVLDSNYAVIDIIDGKINAYHVKI